MWSERQRPNTPDPISDVLGEKRFAERYYPRGLTEVTIGAHSKVPVGFSRFYLLMKPPVAVDYEPHRLADVPHMYCEQKRKWCHEHGIVYVPIFLGERLTNEEFAERVRIERQALERGQPAMNENRALRGVVVAPQLDGADIDREALARLAREVQKNPNLRGATRARRLVTLKRAVERDRLRRKPAGGARNLLSDGPCGGKGGDLP
jgi:hypothetical protein